jgi:hypothetical protein
MAHEHSYGATLKNNKTENQAVAFLLSQDSRFVVPSKEERKEILKRLDLPGTFSRAFDLVFHSETQPVSLSDISVEKLTLIELKTTKKKLLHIPSGFFFGATENEFKLADKLGDQYRFCFVSLHEESMSYVMLSSAELAAKIKTKRVQFQINL